MISELIREVEIFSETEEGREKLDLARSILTKVERYLQSDAYEELQFLTYFLSEQFQIAKQTPEQVLAFRGFDYQNEIPLRNFESAYYLIHGQEMGIKSILNWWANIQHELETYILEAAAKEAAEQENDDE